MTPLYRFSLSACLHARDPLSRLRRWINDCSRLWATTLLGVAIVDRVYRKIDGETRYNTMHKDVARNGDATPRWYLPDSRVVEFACRRDYSAIFRITPEVLKRRRSWWKVSRFAKQRDEKIIRAAFPFVAARWFASHSFERIIWFSVFFIYVHGLLVNSY